MDRNHIWVSIGLLLQVIGSLSTAQIGRKVANLRLTLYYANPKHQTADGYCDRSFHDKWCDTYFGICFSTSNSLTTSSECNIYSMETESHYDKSYVTYIGEDALRIPLRHPIPESIELKISAYDKDRFSSHDFIASFTSRAFKVPAPSVSVNANLVKVGGTRNNALVNITAFLSLECIKGYYGERCSIECLPENYPTMQGCHENGTTICLPGFRGELCDKPDACFYKPCTFGAECLNADTSAGYKCICGGVEGIHCRAGYNPCVPSPCQHQGQCVSTGDVHRAFFCNCPIQWTGELCEVQRSPCEVAGQKLTNADLGNLFGLQRRNGFSFVNRTTINTTISVCKNDGVCVNLMDDFKFICNCTGGWKGKLCEIPNWTNAIIAVCILMGLLMIFLCVVVPCCLRTKILRHRKPQVSARPLIYSHCGSKCPITERIPFKDVFYNSVLGSGTVDLQNADSMHQFYEYCTVNSPSYSQGDLSTFTSNDYETPIGEKPPPELPIRPDSLAPLPKCQINLACQGSVSLASSWSESMYSGHALLHPQSSDFSPVLKETAYGCPNAKGLPKHSVEKKDAVFPKLLCIVTKKK